MRRPLSDLHIVAISAVVSALLTLLTGLPLLRVIGALPLVLILPGYALAAASLPQRSFGWAERLLLSLGLSIATTSLLGLALYWLGVSLQTTAWSSALAATTLAATAVAWQRRKRLAEVSSSTVDVRLNLRQALLLGAAVMIGVAAIRIAQLPTPPDNVSGYTQLWLIPDPAGKTGSYEIGISSQEFGSVTYRLQVIADGRVVQEWPEITLNPGGSWTDSITLPADQMNAGSIEATLYRQDNPTAVYRQVRLHPSGQGN